MVIFHSFLYMTTRGYLSLGLQKMVDIKDQSDLDVRHCRRQLQAGRMVYTSWIECTAGARIIERSQEYKSTVKYRTFVLLRVPIPRGVGKFNYRTGIRSIIKFPCSIIKFPRSKISGTDLIFTAYLYIYNL